MTGLWPIPDHKRERFSFQPAQFEAAGLTPQPSETVSAMRVPQCPVQLEAKVTASHRSTESGFAIVETQVQRVHVAAELVADGTNHVDLAHWRPLFYLFRHYFSIGHELGRSFRAEY